MKVSILSTLTAFLVFSVFANADQGQTDTQSAKTDLEVLNNLMAVMEETTEIATKTRMNADWVPGIVTVLKGDDMEVQGFHTVKEALATTPGMSMASFENNDLLVRGIGKLGSGKLKVLVNGVAITDTTSGLFNTAMSMPTEAVERVEVIRGTGAVMYGENAYTGVVNIITRKEGQRIFGQYGRFNTYRGGGVLSYANTEDKLDVSLNFSGFNTQGGKVQSGPDALAVAHQPESFAPGLTNQERSLESAIFFY
ncbi:exported hypothetical protein [Gammaproteobacteria bacterium]